MNAYEFLFIIQFVVFFGVFVLMLANVFRTGKLYDRGVGFILLILAYISFGVGFVVFLLEYNDLLYARLSQFQSWFLPFFALFFLVHLLLSWGIFGSEQVKSYNPRDVRNNKIYGGVR